MIQKWPITSQLTRVRPPRTHAVKICVVSRVTESSSYTVSGVVRSRTANEEREVRQVVADER